MSLSSTLVRFILPLIVSLSSIAIGAEFAPQVEERLPRARIHPTIVTMESGQEQWFKVVKAATRLNAPEWMQDVKWAINDIPGGNEFVGTISEDGTYTAPASIPDVREVVICAEVEGTSNQNLWGTVLFERDSPPYELVSSWGESREDAQHFVDPHCIALDKDGNILIADYQGSQVTRFTRDGKFLGIIGEGQGEAPGKVFKPRVVMTDPNGDIFVTDQKSDKPRVQVFTHEGKFQRIFAPKGTGPGHILRAHGMDFDEDMNLYIVDVDNMRVNVYTNGGEFIKSWGRDGQRTGEFNAPHGLVTDANGDVFISDYYGTCRKFTGDGEYLFSFAEGDPPDGAVYIHSASGDRWGNVYLMVRGTRGYGGAVEEQDKIPSIMKFNNNGDHVASITLEVSGHKENWATIDDEGRIYAVYMSNDRYGVQIYEPR